MIYVQSCHSSVLFSELDQHLSVFSRVQAPLQVVYAVSDWLFLREAILLARFSTLYLNSIHFKLNSTELLEVSLENQKKALDGDFRK